MKLNLESPDVYRRKYEGDDEDNYESFSNIVHNNNIECKIVRGYGQDFGALEGE